MHAASLRWETSLLLQHYLFQPFEIRQYNYWKILGTNILKQDAFVWVSDVSYVFIWVLMFLLFYSICQNILMPYRWLLKWTSLNSGLVTILMLTEVVGITKRIIWRIQYHEDTDDEEYNIQVDALECDIYAYWMLVLNHTLLPCSFNLMQSIMMHKC